jgi:hypothetical protein
MDRSSKLPGETKMTSLTRRFAVVALLAVLGLGLLSTTANAQFRPNRVGPTFVPNRQPINRNWLVAPGLTIRQWAYNTRKIGQAYSSIPPYLLGYNPYPQVANYGPIYPNYNPYGLYTGVYNPYLYSGIYSNAYNPYGLYGYNYLYQ